MTASPLRCVICGRLKPKGARWASFVGALAGKTPVVCGAACLKVWTTRERPAAVRRAEG